jgi:SAM-dependent methyltransferase
VNDPEVPPSQLRAALYAAVHTGTPGDLDFYRAQCPPGARVLELGCGAGRVLFALAQQCEWAVGLELDPGLRSLAASRIAATAPRVGSNITLHAGDMRKFDLGCTFDRILIPHSGLYCLLTDDEIGDALRSIVRHLAPGGALLVDAYAAEDFHDDTRPADLAEDDLVPVTTVEVDDRTWDVFERSRWDRPGQRIDATYLHVPREAGAAIEITIAQRYLSRDQVASLMRRAGLTITALHGGWGPGDDDAPTWSLVAHAAETKRKSGRKKGRVGS